MQKRRKGRHHPDNNSGDGRTNDHEDENASSKRENLIKFLEVAGSVVFGTLGAALSDAGFHKISFLCWLLAVVCGEAILVHHLQKRGLKHTKPVFVTVVVLTAILFGFLIVNEIKKERPQPDEPFSIATVHAIIDALRPPGSPTPKTSIFICPRNPDAFTHKICEQLTGIFSRCGYLLVIGTPPSDLPESPGVSCFTWGVDPYDPRIQRAMEIILRETGSDQKIMLIPGRFPNRLTAPFHGDFKSAPRFEDLTNQFYSIANGTFSDAVVLIMVRPK